MKVLVVDCYDSFTYNLCQIIGKLGAEPIVVTNDTPLHTIREIDCDRIVLSPGPGRPEETGAVLGVLRTMSPEIPTLGVCLGHQAICIAFGGRVVRGDRPVHGVASPVLHDGRGIFNGCRSPFMATRYHSLVADRTSIPPDLEISAVSTDDCTIMGLRHLSYPIEGVQFHPESVLCEAGNRLIRNFLEIGCAA